MHLPPIAAGAAAGQDSKIAEGLLTEAKGLDRETPFAQSSLELLLTYRATLAGWFQSRKGGDMACIRGPLGAFVVAIYNK